VTWLDLAALGLGLAFAHGCQGSGSTRSEDRPQLIATAESAAGQLGTRAEQAEPTPKAESQPAPAAPLVNRLFELAKDWNLDEPVARIERALAVKLSGDEQQLSGTSTHWPVVVTYHPKRADRRGTLHVSFTDITSTDFAELTRRFGSPTTQVKAKESRVEFDGPSSTRVVAGLLGGLAPTSRVAWIRLEGPGPRPPPPKDLF
jgi:hypothetical protein